MKEEIFSSLENEVPLSECNTGRIFEYIDYLINYSSFDFKRKTFYYQYSYVKVDLTTDLFSKITIEYVLEHLDDFILEKNK